jgi:poly-gamma-glutamate capsule biosynthesis protein CapA/YwtB (metallophosphatase superfamily)
MTTVSRTIFLAGDAMLVRPWSKDRDPSFLELVETIRAADVAIVNLETVIHELDGYAQAESGGIHMHSPPEIAAELEWAGFDMVAHANNHGFDYGSSALLETIEHVERAGLEIAGSGRDLQAARAPRYVRTEGFTVGMVAMASTFISYGKASRSRADLHGRPGVNPLTASLVPRSIVVPRRWGRFLGPVRRRLGSRLLEGDRLRYRRGREISPKDLEGNLASIAEAAGEADIVIVSIHAHRQGAWLESFAGQAIECGADVVFVHGPHEVGAIELRGGKPIFYSLGDFAFEIEQVETFPSDAYEKRGLDPDATPTELRSALSRVGSRQVARREVFEGVVATLGVSSGAVRWIRLHPVDLRFDAIGEGRGRPRIAAPETGRRIVLAIAEKSEKYGTRVSYDATGNCGDVDCTDRH